MPNPTLFEDTVENRGLFSDHYLEEQLLTSVATQELLNDADEALSEAQSLFAEKASEVGGWNEDQTEDEFIRPVLDILGWKRRVQTDTERRKDGIPDYALFSSEEQRQSAADVAEEDVQQVFDYADIVADAKYWGRSLDGPAPDPSRESLAEMRQKNPSFQITHYLFRTGVEWGILTNGSLWRLYSGEAGSLDTYLQINLERTLHLASSDDSGERADAQKAFRLFYVLFRAETYYSLQDGEPVIDRIAKGSRTYAEELEEELENRIFDQVFLELAEGLYKNHRREAEGDPDDVLGEIYHATLRLLYRLLFLLYAESRGLLPVDDPQYQRRSLQRIVEQAEQEVASHLPMSERDHELWNDLVETFRAVGEGDPAYHLPAYNGNLFRLGEEKNAFLDDHSIGLKYLASALVGLTALNPDTDPEGDSVDYKTLDVRRLGSIYEGLLEHKLSHAEEGLAIVRENGDEVYKPLADVEDPAETIEEGDLYLETDEAKRKKSGSYYTPRFIVDYIVRDTLRPVLDERIERFHEAVSELQNLDEDASEDEVEEYNQSALDALLTLRVCDPAMGSGHFLVRAADYIAERYATALDKAPEPNAVTSRLQEIRDSVLQEVEQQGLDPAELAIEDELGDASLLRRLVMKRCIYGVDKNEMAVELAKLSLWLHSFTVGAPLSFLDHHLTDGNSLLGTSVDTVVGDIQEEQGELFENVRDEILEGTRHLQDAAFNSDATVEEVNESAQAFEEYKGVMRPYKHLFDVWMVQHFGHEMGRTLVRDYAGEVIDEYENAEGGTTIENNRETIEAAMSLSKEKKFFHWELEFPEVFYELNPPGRRENPGFDAVIGNPPYVNVKEQDTEESQYFRENIPGVFGRADLAVVFASRMLEQLKQGGRLSYIMTNKFLRTQYGEPFMEQAKEVAQVEEIIDLTDSPVWDDLSTYPAVVQMLRKESCDDEDSDYDGFDTVREVRVDSVEDVKQALNEDGAQSSGQQDSLSISVETNSLGGVCDQIREGSANGKDPVFAGEVRNKVEESVLRPFFYPDDLNRYTKPSEFDNVVIWTYNEDGDLIDLEEYPRLKSYIEENSEELEDRYCVREEEKEVHSYHDPAKKTVSEKTKLAVGDIGLRPNFTIVDEEVVFKNTVYVIIPKRNVDINYLLSILNSRLTFHVMKSISPSVEGGYIRYKTGYLERLPIRKINFTTSDDERDQYVESIIEEYENIRPDTEPDENSVLDAVDDQLSADPKRTGVVHDLLARLAREMTKLKEKKHDLEGAFNPFKYFPRNIGSEPFSEVFSEEIKYGNLLGGSFDLTTEQHSIENARLVKAEDTWIVEVLLKKRDPEDWSSWQKEGNSILREWVPALRLGNVDDRKARYYRYALPRLDQFEDPEDGNFSGTIFPGGYTSSVKTRLWDTPVPEYDQSIDISDLIDLDKEYELTVQKTKFTDELIDQIVYRLYDLSEEEITLIEN